MNNNVIKNCLPYEEYLQLVSKIDKPITDTKQAVKVLNEIFKMTECLLNVDIRDSIRFDSVCECTETPYPYNMELSGNFIGERYHIHLLFLSLEKVVVKEIPFLVIKAGGFSENNGGDGLNLYIQCDDIVVINPTRLDVYTSMLKHLQKNE